ncbi:GFA family protein [Pseudaestuariivita rosea]|uniref:GFA family protein n=1 Tax=Pseudaestuariivita rosea TaxID=2763263 RepID=UPI001F3986F4|nr:GFA family protein [Pseudaestuariivita rosea]
MPSEDNAAPLLTGRCYCGFFTLKAGAAPDTVAYCHCSDCRRLTGAPVGAFAAFKPSDIDLKPVLGDGATHNPGVRRWFCHKCGSPIAAQFDYLPDQIYVPLGIIDQADALAPQIHCYWQNRLSWLQLEDSLEKSERSARTTLIQSLRP